MKESKSDELQVDLTKDEGLNRRAALKGLFVGAAGLAATTALAGCLGDGKPTSNGITDPSGNDADGSSDSSSTVQGSFENPFTQQSYGDYASGLAARNPLLFGGLLSHANATEKVTRLWVEVMDESVLETNWGTFDVLASETLCQDGVTEIRIVDVTSKAVLASRSLESSWQPRFITSMTIPSTTTKVAAYAYIPTKGGWWKGSDYNVADLEVRYSTDSAEIGSHGFFRQALTRYNAGFLNVAPNPVGPEGASEIAFYKDHKHVGHWQTYGRGGARWILADWGTDSSANTQPRAHGDWSSSHNFKGAYVLDQNDQLVENLSYQWGNDSNIAQRNTTYDTSGAPTVDQLIPQKGNGVIAEMKSFVNSAPVELGWGSTPDQAASYDVPHLTIAALPDGITSLRIIWLCSQDGWWESRQFHI